jgi:hypothetical protein
VTVLYLRVCGDEDIPGARLVVRSKHLKCFVPNERVVDERTTSLADKFVIIAVLV